MKSSKITTEPTGSFSLNQPIAKVENKFLYKEDLIQFENNSDSIKIRAKQINDWIKKEIILLHAYNNINNRSFIDKKLKKYEDDLILYQYENELLLNNINYSISDSAISKYYTENIKDFLFFRKCCYTYFITFNY